jgi:hypothetical protein
MTGVHDAGPVPDKLRKVPSRFAGRRAAQGKYACLRAGFLQLGAGVCWNLPKFLKEGR